VIKKNKIRLLSKSLNNAVIVVNEITPIKLTFTDIFKLKTNTLKNVFKLLHYLKILTKNKANNSNILYEVQRHFFIKIYLNSFLKDFIFFEYKLKAAYFNYFIIKENKKQSFISILDTKKQSLVTYSTGLTLCAMGLKRNNMYKALKKQHKGFIKSFSFSKSFILPKFLKSSETIKKNVGIIIKGRGKFTTAYSELPKYLEGMQTKTAFLL
jgi:hypothetical protein